MNYTNLYANVNSYEEALAYQLNIDSSILLLNSNKPEIYMKSKDRMGQSTIRCFKLEEFTPEDPSNKYATREELSAISNQINEIKDLIVKAKEGAING